ncbi:UNVERIFIED_CONTAM: hypothetical protein GTU68_017436, partial [Idotea baltica]|nr:hypothetical protein [Idotea baltica]
MSDDEEDEFTSSELGTKEFWTETYKEELGNFISNGDIGDIWYGEDSAIRV